MTAVTSAEPPQPYLEGEHAWGRHMRHLFFALMALAGSIFAMVMGTHGF